MVYDVLGNGDCDLRTLQRIVQEHLKMQNGQTITECIYSTSSSGAKTFNVSEFVLKTERTFTSDFGIEVDGKEYFLHPAAITTAIGYRSTVPKNLKGLQHVAEKLAVSFFVKTGSPPCNGASHTWLWKHDADLFESVGGDFELSDAVRQHIKDKMNEMFSLCEDEWTEHPLLQFYLVAYVHILEVVTKEHVNFELCGENSGITIFDSSSPLEIKPTGTVKSKRWRISSMPQPLSTFRALTMANWLMPHSIKRRKLQWTPLNAVPLQRRTPQNVSLIRFME